MTQHPLSRAAGYGIGKSIAAVAFGAVLAAEVSATDRSRPQLVALPPAAPQDPHARFRFDIFAARAAHRAPQADQQLTTC